MNPTAAKHRGFTLVELLVVIGIIALLISLLLPALATVRQASLRTACAAKIHGILLAAQLHAMDHQGYYPLAGVLPGPYPANLNDTYRAKYDYFQDDAGPVNRFPAPITFALSLQMAHANNLANPNNSYLGPEETDSQGLIKNFLCPAQAASVSELTQLPILYISPVLVYTEAESYVFNEAICGWSDPYTSNRLQGLARLVHQPTATMFVADGLMGYTGESRLPWYNQDGMLTLYNKTSTPPVTMADAYNGGSSPHGVAGDKANFDLIRHRKKINVGFCDGHVETRYITVHDLSTVFLLAP